MCLFTTLLDRLDKLGWTEIAPSARYWTFVKRNWLCNLDWYTGQVTFSGPLKRRERSEDQESGIL